MATILTYGNRPPARATIGLGRIIRTTELRQMVLSQHEAWVNSLETCGGIAYIGDLAPLTITSTVLTYGSSNGWGLERFLPYIEFETRLDIADNVRLFWKAYVRNLQVQVEVLYSDYTLAASVSTSDATSNDPQWIGTDILVTDMNADNGRILRVSIKRLGFASDGTLYQFACRSSTIDGGDIPGQ